MWQLTIFIQQIVTECLSARHFPGAKMHQSVTQDLEAEEMEATNLKDRIWKTKLMKAPGQNKTNNKTEIHTVHRQQSINTEKE